MKSDEARFKQEYEEYIRSQGNVAYRTGMAAIKLRVDVNKIDISNTQIPNFTLEEAKDYVLTRRMTRETFDADIASRKILRAEFMTSKQASEVLDTSIGVADEDVVCLVEQQGEAHIPTPPGTNGVIIGHNIYFVFDGLSGHMLVEASR